MIDRDAKTPLYVQVKEIIKNRIAEGVYLQDELLPTEAELTEMMDVSRITIRKALSDLVHGGLIYRVSGKGTFVCRNPKDTRRTIDDLRLIGVVIPGDAVPKPHQLVGFRVLCGAEKTAKTRGYSILFRDSQEDLKTELQDVRELIDGGAKAIVLWPTVKKNNPERSATIDELEKLEIPYVLVDRYFDAVDSDCVVADNYGGMYTATTHLCKLGYKRIGFVTGPDLSINSIRQRYEGYKEAVRAHLGNVTGQLILDNWLEEADYDKCLLRFVNDKRLDALVAQNDNYAATIYDVLTKEGIRIPDDIALVGFDDSVGEGRPDIPLTTIRQSGEDMGRIAVLRVIDRLEGTADAEHRGRWERVVPTTLVIRDTCGASRRWEKHRASGVV